MQREAVLEQVVVAMWVTAEGDSVVVRARAEFPATVQWSVKSQSRVSCQNITPNTVVPARNKYRPGVCVTFALNPRIESALHKVI